MKVVVGDKIITGSMPAKNSKRKFKNFIKAYLDFTDNQEATEKIHMWTAISTIAGALERKVFLRRAHFMIFPNLYIVIVGPAGLIKKSTATGIGVSLLRDLPNVRMLAQRVSDAALIEALRRSGDKYINLEGKEQMQSAVYCYASELTTLLKDTHGVVVEFLTDLFDCQPYDSNKPWIRETRGEGQIKVFGPCLNLLSCATPTSIKDCIPISQMEAGFASRVLFVVEPSPPKRYIAIPRHDPNLEKNRNDLIHDLMLIHQMVGEMTMTPAAEQRFVDYYGKIKEAIHDRGYDAKFSGYYGRKDLMLQKLAAINSAAESDSLLIEESHLVAAMQQLESLEENMFKLFASSGKNEDAGLIIAIVEYIKLKGPVSESQVNFKFMSNLEFTKFKPVMEYLIRIGQLRQVSVKNEMLLEAVPGAIDLNGWKD